MKIDFSAKRIVTVIIAILLFSVPYFRIGDYLLTVFVLSFIFAIVAASWNIINGWAGVFNFAQIAFFAIGAYISGALASSLGVPPIVGIWIGGVAASLAAVGIGIPTLRLRGAYIALLTFAYHSFIQSILVSPNLTKWTGGAFGIVVPALSLGGGKFSVEQYYITALIILIITMITLHKVLNSHIGIAFQASRDAFEYSLSRGINDIRYRALAFVVGSFFTGVAGALYGHFNGFVDTTVFGWEFTWKTLAMMVVGGLGTFSGPMVSAVFLTFLLEWMRFLGVWRFVALGVLLWLVTVFVRRGFQQVIDLFFEKISWLSEKITGGRVSEKP